MPLPAGPAIANRLLTRQLPKVVQPAVGSGTTIITLDASRCPSHDCSGRPIVATVRALGLVLSLVRVVAGAASARSPGLQCQQWRWAEDAHFWLQPPYASADQHKR